MFQTSYVSLSAIVLGGFLLPLTAQAGEHIADLQPFLHVASIAAGADVSTIRFENARLVQAPSKIRVTNDAGSCSLEAFRDPGGSFACSATQTVETVAAWEVTYSLTGQPLASDEYGGRYFTFRVYFRPDELPRDAQAALAKGRMNRKDVAAYFVMSANRETVSQIAINASRSHLCDGNYVDGAWVRNDAVCKDEVNVATVRTPSSYITVKVAPASAQALQARVGK